MSGSRAHPVCVRAAGLAALGLLALLLAACSESDRDGTAVGWKETGDAAFTAGDEMFARAESGRLPEVREEAVAAWVEAANAYIYSFRLEDPVESRRTTRAMLAFRVGRALSKASLHGVTHPYRDQMAERAVRWFAEAYALEPGLRASHYERAVLFDSEIASVRDLLRARRAYRRFVRESGAAGASPSQREQAFLARADERLTALEALLGPERDD